MYWQLINLELLKYASMFQQMDGEMAARRETVLNTTMAEMETYHAPKCEDDLSRLECSSVPWKNLPRQR
jgi:hypothetical protein